MEVVGTGELKKWGRQRPQGGSSVVYAIPSATICEYQVPGNNVYPKREWVQPVQVCRDNAKGLLIRGGAKGAFCLYNFDEFLRF